MIFFVIWFVFDVMKNKLKEEINKLLDKYQLEDGKDQIKFSLVN